MCCSELIKTFDFFPECACFGGCACMPVYVCAEASMCPLQKQSYMCICTGEEKALGLLRCNLFSFFFSNLVILITVHIYLHFLFVSALDRHL